MISIASCGSLLGMQVGLWSTGQSYSLFDVLPHLVSAALVAVCYGLVGFAVAATTGRRGLALGISSAFAFLGFLIN